jgi:hypothetical protein
MQAVMSEAGTLGMLSLQQTSNATSDRARIAVLVCTHPSTIPLMGG